MTGFSDRSRARVRRPRPPLEAESLRELALRYVGRYATTQAKLRRYLDRKLRERGWEGEGAADIDGIVERFAELGYVNDRLYGEAKARDMAARGYGSRRIGGALRQAGLEDEARGRIAAEVDDAAALEAYARRRRIGPFASEPPDRDTERKQFAACMRAGHDYELVKRLFSGDLLDEADEI